MKKDFFDITFFIESTEITSLLKFCPYKLYDGHQNLLSSLDVEVLNLSEKNSFPIDYVGETYFIIEASKIDQPRLMHLFKIKLDQYFDFRRKLHLHDFNKNLANDLLGSLSKIENKNPKFEESLVKFLRLLKSKLIVQECNLFIVEEKIKFLPWLSSEVSPKKASKASQACVSLVSNLRKIFLSNQPLTNKIYITCEPETTEVLQNFIYAPLVKNKDVLGVLEIKNKLLGDFSEFDVEIVGNACVLLSQFLLENWSENLLEQSEQTTSGLGKYISSNLLAQVKEKTVNLDEILGVEKEIVVLFAKIQNFDEISLKVSPSSLIYLLNYHFEVMSRVISKFNGTIDKFLGNVIMVTWGHPEVQINALDLSLKTAMEMQKAAMEEISLVWKERGILNYSIGIGINKGVAVAGNLGAKQFMDFTVIGDTINIAQRLESMAQSGEIWIKTEVFNSENDLSIIPIKTLKGIKIKGKDKPLDVFVLSPKTQTEALV